MFASLALVATAWGAAGNRDRSFGKKGLAIIDEPSEVNEEFANLLILKSGRIFAASSSANSSATAGR